VTIAPPFRPFTTHSSATATAFPQMLYQFDIKGGPEICTLIIQFMLAIDPHQPEDQDSANVH